MQLLPPVENQLFVTIAVSLDISLQIVLIQNKTSSMTTQYNKSCAAAASTTSSDLDSTTNKLVCSA